MAVLIETGCLNDLINLKVSFKASDKSTEIIINKIIKTSKFELIIKIMLFAFNFSIFKLSAKH